MTTNECTAGSFLQLSIAAIFLGYVLLHIRKRFSKPAPCIIVSDDDNITDLGRDFTPNEINAILRFKEYLLELQDLAQKTSEEKARFSVSDKEDNFATDHALIEMSKKYNSVQESINEAIEYKQHRTDDRFEQAQKLISTLEREIFTFKNDLRNYPPPMTPVKYSVESITQTDEDPSSKSITKEEFSLERLDKDNIKHILTSVKDCMDTIVEESGLNWKNTTEEISKFLKGNHDDTKKQLETSVTEYLERNDHLQISACESLLLQTATIEKQLFNIFLFLDRQLLDAQAVAETLKFFNRKFVHFAQKCDKRWEDSCTNFITTCNRVQEAQENMNFGSTKMSRISYSLTKHSEALENLQKEFGVVTQTVATVIASGDFGSHGKDQIDAACYSIADMERRVFKIEDVYTFNMSCILELIEKPGVKLESLLQYIEELSILNDLVRSITKTYESMISLTSGEGGMINQLRLFGGLKDEDTSQNGDESEKFSFGDSSQTLVDNRSSSFFESVSRRQMISMLNDAIKRTAPEKSRSNNNSAALRNDSKESWIQCFMEAESKMKHLNIWGSETALSDINSDCLLPRSSGSSVGED